MRVDQGGGVRGSGTARRGRGTPALLPMTTASSCSPTHEKRARGTRRWVPMTTASGEARPTTDVPPWSRSACLPLAACRSRVRRYGAWTVNAPRGIAPPPGPRPTPHPTSAPSTP